METMGRAGGDEGKNDCAESLVSRSADNQPSQRSRHGEQRLSEGLAFTNSLSLGGSECLGDNGVHELSGKPISSLPLCLSVS